MLWLHQRVVVDDVEALWIVADLFAYLLGEGFDVGYFLCVDGKAKTREGGLVV